MHHCHADGCTVEVAPRLVMCPRHWFMVPKPLQRALWRTYRKGQEIDKRPSYEYLEIQRACVQAVYEAEQHIRARRLLAAQNRQPKPRPAPLFEALGE